MKVEQEIFIIEIQVDPVVEMEETNSFWLDGNIFGGNIISGKVMNFDNFLRSGLQVILRDGKRLVQGNGSCYQTVKPAFSVALSIGRGRTVSAMEIARGPNAFQTKKIQLGYIISRHFVFTFYIKLMIMDRTIIQQIEKISQQLFSSENKRFFRPSNKKRVFLGQAFIL